jgi:hypothetical protein
MYSSSSSTSPSSTQSFNISKEDARRITKFFYAFINYHRRIGNPRGLNYTQWNSVMKYLKRGYDVARQITQTHAFVANVENEISLMKFIELCMVLVSHGVEWNAVKHVLKQSKDDVLTDILKIGAIRTNVQKRFNFNDILDHFGKKYFEQLNNEQCGDIITQLNDPTSELFLHLLTIMWEGQYDAVAYVLYELHYNVIDKATNEVIDQVRFNINTRHPMYGTITHVAFDKLKYDELRNIRNLPKTLQFVINMMGNFDIDYTIPCRYKDKSIARACQYFRHA